MDRHAHIARLLERVTIADQVEQLLAGQAGAPRDEVEAGERARAFHRGTATDHVIAIAREPHDASRTDPNRGKFSQKASELVRNSNSFLA
jgi:hypothetical protein